MTTAIIRRLFLGLVCFLYVSNAAISQRLTRYEYWFSNNNVRTERTFAATTSESTIADSVDVSSLSLGLNILNFRFGTATRWSAVQTNFFYRLNAVGNGNVSTYEYWFDDQTNRMSGNVLNSSSNTLVMDSVDISNLGFGLHRFNIRFGGANGWSSVTTQFFYRLPNNSDKSLTAYEYWFDDQTNKRVTRPLSINGSDNVVLDSVSIDSLNLGLHRLNIRFAGKTGWSSVATQFFYKLQNNGNQRVAAYEYWFDNDTGNRTSKSVNSNLTDAIVMDSVNVSSLRNGIHTFNVRFLGKDGWGSISSSFFYKFNNGQQISGIEYWINNDSTSRKFQNLTANTEGVILDMIDVSNLCKGTHRLVYRFQTPIGWSSAVADTFYKATPSANGAKADFKLTVENNLVACQSVATNAQRIVWKFGNGDSSLLRNPFYTYRTAGVYNLCQIASNNLGCPNDTFCQIINIRGIRSITPNKSGKNSNVTVRILGGGFHDSTKVKFTRTGSADLIPKRTFVENSGSIRCGFEFRNAPVGFWTVVLTLPNGDTMSLRNGFEVLDSAATDLWIAISGDRIIRPGFPARYKVNYGNNGFSDAIGVPISIRGLPKNCTATINGDSVNVFQFFRSDTFRVRFDSTNHAFANPDNVTSDVWVIVPNVPANSSGLIDIKINVPQDVDQRRRYPIAASISEPMFENLSQEGNTVECITGITDIVINGIPLVLGLNDWTTDVRDCISNGKQLIYTIIKSSVEATNEGRTRNSPGALVYMRDIAQSFIMTAYPCMSSFPAGRFFKVADFFMEVIGKMQSGIGVVDGWGKVQDNCSFFKKRKQGTIEIGTGFAFDPNIKLGPGEGSAAHYFSSPSRIVPYTILCENDSMATLPAQIITVIDTLDKTKLEAASVGFTYVTLSDKTVSLSNAPQSFIADIDLRSTTGFIARVVGSVDTAKGIIKWVVNTLDPVTRQITENPAAGILPPNRRKPEGEGAFGFIINKKAGLPDSTTIANKAAIVFDYNTPIITPIWKAVVDDTKPSSEMTALSATQRDTGFIIRWTGRDNLSGVQSYDIFVSRNFAPYRLWKRFGARTDSTRFGGERGITYRYYSVAIDSAGNVENAPLSSDATTRIEGTNSVSFIPKNNSWLGQNRPNPFQQTTEIPFYLDRFTQRLDLTIFDVAGKPVKRIQKVDIPEGTHTLEVDLSDMPLGVYLYQLNLGKGQTFTKRMILLR